jgi:hypothetical protein
VLEVANFGQPDVHRFEGSKRRCKPRCGLISRHNICGHLAAENIASNTHASSPLQTAPPAQTGTSCERIDQTHHPSQLLEAANYAYTHAEQTLLTCSRAAAIGRRPCRASL